jgi:hypothetical protein
MEVDKLKFFLNMFKGLMSQADARAQAGSQMRSGHHGSKRSSGPNRNVNRMQRRSRRINQAYARAQ